MPSGDSHIVTLVVLVSFLSSAVSMSRKYLMKQFSPSSIMYIDTIFTSAMILVVSVFLSGIERLNSDFARLDLKSLSAFLGGSLAITGSIFLGLYLLKYNELSYLVVLETGVELMVAALVGMLFLGEKVTLSKVIGLIIIGFGIYVLNN